jgi:hypothetical protein
VGVHGQQQVLHHQRRGRAGGTKREAPCPRRRLARAKLLARREVAVREHHDHAPQLVGRLEQAVVGGSGDVLRLPGIDQGKVALGRVFGARRRDATREQVLDVIDRSGELDVTHGG